MPVPGGVPAPQEVRFCRSVDGVRIAYAVHGTGPPLLISTCWLSHLQFDWESPVWRHFLADLGRIATVIRFDERGYGLSDWDATDFSLGMRVADLEAVADDAGYRNIADDPAKVAELDEILADLGDRHLDGGRMGWEYLLVVATRG